MRGGSNGLERRSGRDMRMPGHGCMDMPDSRYRDSAQHKLEERTHAPVADTQVRWI